MKNQGFIALITVLTVSAIALVISSAVLLKSITEARISLDEESANKAFATVNACAETALQRLASTTGDGVNTWNTVTANNTQVTIAGNSCYYSINGTGTSTSRLINASSTVNTFVRKISATVATNTPSMSVTAWSIVADLSN